jgi:hypothetical protein
MIYIILGYFKICLCSRLFQNEFYWRHILEQRLWFLKIYFCRSGKCPHYDGMYYDVVNCINRSFIANQIIGEILRDSRDTVSDVFEWLRLGSSECYGKCSNMR